MKTKTCLFHFGWGGKAFQTSLLNGFSWGLPPPGLGVRCGPRNPRIIKFFPGTAVFAVGASDAIAVGCCFTAVGRRSTSVRPDRLSFPR